MKYISLNPLYTLKPDYNKVLLMARYVGRDFIENVNDSTTSIIHPIYAMILSFIDGEEYYKCIYNAARFLNVSKELVAQFVDKLIDNPNQVYITKDNVGSSLFFPKTIISRKTKIVEKRYTPKLFEYNEINLRIGRHFTPTHITLMFNNICYTDCIYCYEDKSVRLNCQIPFQRIIELIREARELHVVSFNVVGGEFFLYPKWREVLKELIENKFDPYISTKMPLAEKDIKFLSDIGVYDIQVSLDSGIEEHLIKSIGVKKGYFEQMKSFLKLLDKYNIPVMLHTVLTQYNDSIEDMESIYSILDGLNNIQKWHVVKGDETLYPRIPYKDIEISSFAMRDISIYLKELSEKSRFRIKFPQDSIKIFGGTDSLSISKDSKTVKTLENFFSRSYCSGLYSSLYILPTGKVTICEQLYWGNPKFYVGDILFNSLDEVWNSEASKRIFFIKQTDIPSDSLCHSCQDFTICRTNKQVCYRDIIKKHGSEKWYYPDVNCPYAAEI